MLPSPDILNDYEHGKFVLSNLAAKRAKQLREGAPPLVQVESNHPLTIALAEIAAGKIKPILSGVAEAIEPTSEMTLLIDENVPAELGMLLPALDESEAAMVTAVDHDEADAEIDHEDALSLSDLVEEEDEDAAAIASDDDTLSLTDIAEQEESGDDEETEEV
ncbi:DNA-directed RNA polymerase subunit omega [Fimbriimonas ginsengisoli]|uniref:DNA-directed RNA polymerase subunit omega n=1 Tax=Fimbriimonas ginsengisoli Gsoil 348 TaxID=661478 RepID=A0A068NX69_FIMGI|nr:DNA-directed RNA polymerase subunit omega [Fimbriimonas ginsengisoli]AIE88093.1 DNA-directed RNA polymerase, omega subunit [Fimbriimonas ginsengisoli Gsoil 348]